MCWESASCRIDAHCVYFKTSALGIYRASGSKSVPSHRASQHVGTDVRKSRDRDLDCITFFVCNEVDNKSLCG
jgi:hypothetical protein